MTPNAGTNDTHQGKIQSKRMNTIFGITEKSNMEKSILTEALWNKPNCKPSSAISNKIVGIHQRTANGKAHSRTPIYQSQASGANANKSIDVTYNDDLSTFFIFGAKLLQFKQTCANQSTNIR